MLRFERHWIVGLVISTAIFGGCVAGGLSVARGEGGSEWRKPFQPDEHTVVLYHFDEGEGNAAHDACGDPALTLHANKRALWGERDGFGTTARFVRSEDDANVFVGPANNDKFELRTCTEGWTVEAWVRYTGPYGQDGGNTYANICGTDEEGFSLPDGARRGWNFSLHSGKAKDQLVSAARFCGGKETIGKGTSGWACPIQNSRGTTVRERVIADKNWHHVAWQFRFADQTYFLFIDGTLIWKVSTPNVRIIILADRCDIPFQVGGFLHSQNPPFYLKCGNFEGEIDELRISNIMRYPVADRLTIVQPEFDARRTAELPDAGLGVPYKAPLSADGANGRLTWQIVSGALPKGLSLDWQTGVISGVPTEVTRPQKVTIGVTDAAGQTDQHTFTIQMRPGRIVTKPLPMSPVDRSLPLAFVGYQYDHQLQTEYMSNVQWKILSGELPQGMTFDSQTAKLSGTPTAVACTTLRFQAKDPHGQTDEAGLVLKVVPAKLRRIKPDEHTVALWDWQGPSGKLIPDRMGDEDLMLTWVNMISDQRELRPGWGLYSCHVGCGEYGFVGPQHNDKVDLRTCSKQWTVETWLRSGGPIGEYGIRFDFGHVCGTYDNTERGVWELYLSNHSSPDGSMAPGVHFLGAEPDQALRDLHPWKRPKGIVGDPADAAIRDTEWHHVAWQYSYAEDLHQLFLDGKLIWQMQSPDGRKLVNNRKHDAQFSIGSRLTGYARYGGAFGGGGAFFGQIGEIRISDIRRY